MRRLLNQAHTPARINPENGYSLYVSKDATTEECTLYISYNHKLIGWCACRMSVMTGEAIAILHVPSAKCCDLLNALGHQALMFLGSLSIALRQSSTSGSLSLLSAWFSFGLPPQLSAYPNENDLLPSIRFYKLP